MTGPADRAAAQRSLRSRKAAHVSWANTADPTARTAPARSAAWTRFERQVDPDGTMEPAERARRAASARKAFYTDLAYRSARARGARRAAHAPVGPHDPVRCPMRNGFP